MQQLLQTKSVAHLLSKVNQLERLSSAFNESLPSHLHHQCQILNVANNTLTISVSDPTIGHQIYYQQAQILANINRRLVANFRMIKIKTSR